jgi:hypothetical protein
LACAAGLAYKVISGYQPASPEHFIRVQDRNKVPAASAADPDAPAVSVAAGAATAITSAPPAAPADASQTASSVAPGADLPAEVQDSSECAAIKTEQQEINTALNKQHSPEETRYMQRRLRELAEQSKGNAHC